MSTNRILRAATFAVQAHGIQVRKYTGEPYVRHVFEVAEIVASVTTDEDTIIAAMLHDVLEDTSMEPSDISLRFGFIVLDLVMQLTDSKVEPGINRAARKANDCSRLSLSSPAAATIKLADLMNNTESIVKYAPNFAKVYLAEKMLALTVLSHGHAGLYHLAKEQVFSALEKLGPK